MPRTPRTDVGGLVYHVLNRANARAPLFDDEADYRRFTALLAEERAHTGMRLLAWCLMPNHWHLVNAKGVRTLYAARIARYDPPMPRTPRTDVGGLVYHVLNRANARAPLFDDTLDYRQFKPNLPRSMRARKLTIA